MSKTKKVKPVDLEKIVMKKVMSGEVVMKPKWYFIFGSILTLIGLIGSSIGTVFLVNLSLFLLRQHGPMGGWRLQQMIESFPWWVPVLAVAGMVLGVWLLKKYDFSYHKNFKLVAVGFISAVIVAAVIIDRLGLDEVWFRQGPIRRFYQRYENRVLPDEGGWRKGGKGSGWGRTNL